MLRWAGLPKVALLDGGRQAWQAAGAPVDQDAVDANFVTAIAQRLGLTDVLADDVDQGHMPLRQREAIAAQLDATDTCIIATLTVERYRGEVGRLSPVA